MCHVLVRLQAWPAKPGKAFPFEFNRAILFLHQPTTCFNLLLSAVTDTKIDALPSFCTPNIQLCQVSVADIAVSTWWHGMAWKVSVEKHFDPTSTSSWRSDETCNRICAMDSTPSTRQGRLSSGSVQRRYRHEVLRQLEPVVHASSYDAW